MILYNLEKAKRHKAIAYNIQAAVVAVHAAAFSYLGVPFLWALVWSVFAMLGLIVLAGFFMAAGRAMASNEIYDELVEADIPHTVHHKDSPI